MSDITSQDNGNVIPLSRLSTESGKHQPVTEIEKYWQEIRGGRLVPARSEIEPRKIGMVLRNAFILERLAPTVARFRLAGMHLNELLGMEVRGMPLTTFFLPDARGSVGEALEEVFSTPSVARFQLSGDRGIGKPPLDAQMILLPLKSDMGEISRVLGCLSTVGPIGRAPRRFEVTERQITPLVADQPTLGREPDTWDGRFNTVETQPKVGFAEPRTPFQHGRTPPPRVADGERPHLYVVKNDD